MNTNNFNNIPGFTNSNINLNDKSSQFFNYYENQNYYNPNNIPCNFIPSKEGNFQQNTQNTNNNFNNLQFYQSIYNNVSETLELKNSNYMNIVDYNLNNNEFNKNLHLSNMSSANNQYWFNRIRGINNLSQGNFPTSSYVQTSTQENLTNTANTKGNNQNMIFRCENPSTVNDVPFKSKDMNKNIKPNSKNDSSDIYNKKSSDKVVKSSQKEVLINKNSTFSGDCASSISNNYINVKKNNNENNNKAKLIGKNESQSQQIETIKCLCFSDEKANNKNFNDFIQCQDCKSYQHKQCFGEAIKMKNFECHECQTNKIDFYLKRKLILMKNIFIKFSEKDFVSDYELELPDLLGYTRDLDNTKSYFIVFRSLRLDSKGYEHHWPLNFEININNDKVKKEFILPKHPPRAKSRVDFPLIFYFKKEDGEKLEKNHYIPKDNFYSYKEVFRKKNLINLKVLYSKNDKDKYSYCVSLELMYYEDNITNIIKEIEVLNTKEEVLKCFSKYKNSEISIIQEKISFIDIYTGTKKIEFPARSKNCLHFSVFDLKIFINFTRKTKYFECPICKNKCVNVYIDGVIQEYIKNNPNIDEVSADSNYDFSHEISKNYFSNEKNNSNKEAAQITGDNSALNNSLRKNQVYSLLDDEEEQLIQELFFPNAIERSQSNENIMKKEADNNAKNNSQLSNNSPNKSNSHEHSFDNQIICLFSDDESYSNNNYLDPNISLNENPNHANIQKDNNILERNDKCDDTLSKKNNNINKINTDNERTIDVFEKNKNFASQLKKKILNHKNTKEINKNDQINIKDKRLFFEDILNDRDRILKMSNQITPKEIQILRKRNFDLASKQFIININEDKFLDQYMENSNKIIEDSFISLYDTKENLFMRYYDKNYFFQFFQKD